MRRGLLPGSRRTLATCTRRASPAGSLGTAGGFLQAVLSAISSRLAFSYRFLPDMPASCCFLFTLQHWPQAARRKPECLAGCSGERGSRSPYTGCLISARTSPQEGPSRARRALPLPQRARMYHSPQILTCETVSGCHSLHPGSWFLAVTLRRGGNR